VVPVVLGHARSSRYQQHGRQPTAGSSRPAAIDQPSGRTVVVVVSVILSPK